MEVDKTGSVTLIRAVRSLDDDNDLPLPDKIQKIWLLLSASKGTRLHAVEETILRWLCKHMAGNNESAELVRRYPLTWTVLAHAFSKIPPQSLGRSLADRRFVGILRQTLDDLSTSHRNAPASSTQTNGAVPEKKDSSKKRKRRGEIPSDIDSLRKHEGCALSAVQVFKALEQLLQPGNGRGGAVGPEARVGAEHIRSLFSSSPDEIRDLTASLLWICHLFLRNSELGISHDQRQWIQVLSKVWGLRLHSKDESHEFATYLYQPMCALLSALKEVDGVEPAKGTTEAKEVWTRELDRFLSVYLIRPCRQQFALDGGVQVINTALDVTGKSPVASSIIIWDVASRSSRDTTDPASKSEHAAWAQKVFGAILPHLRGIESSYRNHTLSRILATAVQTESVPSAETLRKLFDDYALDSGKADWELAHRIVACDSDVFIMDASISEKLFDHITAASSEGAERKNHIIENVILPLMDAFARARDFSSFAKQWYRCLCLEHKKAGSSKPVDKSIWTESDIRDRFSATVQTSLSGTQLQRLLESLESEISIIGAQLVIADAICSGLTEQGTFEMIGPTLSSLVSGAKKYKKLPSSSRALRWRVTSAIAGWETSDGVHQLWVDLGTELSKALSRGELSDDETFEAYKCCYCFLLANRPDGSDEDELNRLLLSFLERVQAVPDSGKPASIPSRYLESIFADLPRLAEAWNHTNKSISQVIVSLYRIVGLQSSGSTQDVALSKHIPSLLDNFSVRDQEALIEALITPSIYAIEGDEKQAGWTQPQGLSLILTILEFPREALTKSRRKTIMGSWKLQVTSIMERASQDKPYASALLRLLVRIMEWPTFYEKMEFSDLVSMTTNLTYHDEGILRLAQTFVRRTVDHVMSSADEILVGYCKDVSAYIESLKAKKCSTPQYILMASVVSALSKDGLRKPVRSTLDPDVASKKIRHVVKEGLDRFDVKGSSTETLRANTIPLQAILDCAQNVSSAVAEKPIAVSDETLEQLETLSKSYIQFQPELGWKLRIFLVGNRPSRYDAASILSFLREAADSTDEDSVHGLIESYVKGKEPSASRELLETLIGDDAVASGSLGPLLGVSQTVDKCFDSSPGPAGSQDEAPIIAKLHVKIAWMLHQATSLGHFKCLSNLLLKLLDKYSTCLSQFNIELTLSTVIWACSSSGPRIEGQAATAAGEIYEKLYQLVAVIIRKHRHRLEGHFPVLIGALQALLGVLLANPAASPSTTRPRSCCPPPWLHARLQARHATKFSRLLTLVCEPSAAAVSRSRINTLDSARDVAKRAAGRDMFTVLETYIKLQLEGGNVPRDVRKALEAGMYSVLNITPEGGRRVLNESIDSNGRAVFKQMYAEYTKFGTWTGV